MVKKKKNFKNKKKKSIPVATLIYSRSLVVEKTLDP